MNIVFKSRRFREVLDDISSQYLLKTKTSRNYSALCLKYKRLIWRGALAASREPCPKDWRLVNVFYLIKKPRMKRESLPHREVALDSGGCFPSQILDDDKYLWGQPIRVSGLSPDRWHIPNDTIWNYYYIVCCDFCSRISCGIIPQTVKYSDHEGS